MLSRSVDLLILIYRLVISPVIHWFCGPYFGCRFVPSCSQYAHEAVAVHGFFKGSRLSLFRICRCNPLSTAGYDPVPHAIEPSQLNHKSQYGR